MRRDLVGPHHWVEWPLRCRHYQVTDTLTAVHCQFVRQCQESSDSGWFWSLDRLRSQGIDGRKVERSCGDTRLEGLQLDQVNSLP